MRFPVLFSLALLACGLTVRPALAQPAVTNDQCSAATLLTSGVAVGGTTAGAADDIPGVVGCQPAGTGSSFPEVWYAFVATAPTLSYELVGGQSGDTLGLHLFEGPCANLILTASACGQDRLVGTHNGLTMGSTYYLAVTAGSPALFALRIYLTNAAISPSQDCNNAVVLTHLTTIQQGGLNLGSGLDPNEVMASNSCWGGGGERQPKWYRFTAGSTGRLEFNINPLDPQTDYDWAVWDITGDPPGCTTKGNAIACNWTGARGATGLSSCPSLEPGYQGGDQFDNTTTAQTGAQAPIIVQAGRVYALLVDNFTTNSVGYTLTFGGACGPPPPNTPAPAIIGLTATFAVATRPAMAVDFTPDITISPALAVTYYWSFGDGSTSTLRTPSHTYATPGTYFATLRVTDLLGTTATYARQLTASITGVPEAAARAARLTLAPNPARQTVRLTLAEPAAEGATARLTDAFGRLVRTCVLRAHATTTDLDLTGLRPGVYSVQTAAGVRRLVIAE